MTEPYKTDIVTPAASQNLTTVDAVKAELGIAGSSEDAYLTGLIAAASAACAHFCNRIFVEEKVVDSFRLRSHWAAQPPLILSRYPVGEIDTVIESGSEVDEAGYEVDARSGLLWRLSGDSRAAWASGKVDVTYNGGYPTNAIPADLARACLAQVTHIYRAKGRDPLLKRVDIDGVIEREFWVGSIGGSGALCPEAEGYLSSFVRYVV